jgi:hypothetical protein
MSENDLQLVLFRELGPCPECHWPRSCKKDGCWRDECAESGQPVFGRWSRTAREASGRRGE